MASKTTPAKKSTNRAAAAKRVSNKPAHAGDPAADVKPYHGSPEATAMNAAAATAAQQTAVRSDTTFGAAVRAQTSDIESAMAQRASDMHEMQAKAREQQVDAAAEPARIEDKLSHLQIDRVPPETVVVQPASPATGPVVNRLPGTGVADPRDLAPGQDISPCPPGGLSITPQPNKPGTLYSKL